MRTYKRNLWGSRPRRDLGPDVAADLVRELDDEAADLLDHGDPDTQGRAAERLLGRAVREVVRR